MFGRPMRLVASRSAPTSTTRQDGGVLLGSAMQHLLHSLASSFGVMKLRLNIMGKRMKRAREIMSGVKLSQGLGPLDTYLPYVALQETCVALS